MELYSVPWHASERMITNCRGLDGSKGAVCKCPEVHTSGDKARLEETQSRELNRTEDAR